MGDSNIKSERPDTPGRWTPDEEAALIALAKDPVHWTAAHIASLLHRQGFALRSRSAVLGRLHRNGISLREPLPAHQAAARLSRKKNREARRKMLAEIGEIKEHPNTVKTRIARSLSAQPAERHRRKDNGLRRPLSAGGFDLTKRGEGLPPDTGILKRHATPEGDSLGLPLASLSAKQCHFPFGLFAPFTYCGLPCLDGEPYCPKHFRLTHTNSSMRVSPEGERLD